MRRTFASVLYAIGEDPGTVMDELGHTDEGSALRIYPQAMRREDGEREKIRALLEDERLGSPMGSREPKSAVVPLHRKAA
jgi:integrase